MNRRSKGCLLTENEIDMTMGGATSNTQFQVGHDDRQQISRSPQLKTPAWRFPRHKKKELARCISEELRRKCWEIKAGASMEMTAI